MKQYYSKPLVGIIALMALIPCQFIAQTVTTQTFSFTGTIQSFTVPPCVSVISVQARGAQGGPNAQGVLGGLGGLATGVMTVTSGQVLTIFVGGMNGYNGGGSPT